MYSRKCGLGFLQITLILLSYYDSVRSDDDPLSGNEDSSEIIGAAISQVYRHPYIASIQHNNKYTCSAVIVNSHWLLTVSKCFEPSLISSYVTYYHLKNYTVRVGSSYNNKGGDLYKIRMMMHNFDMRVSAIKVQGPMSFGPRVQPIQLPNPGDEVSLGYLVTMTAWTPSGHLRLINAPSIDPYICETYTKLKIGQFICVGGVQDPDRHFCRKDNGGAIVQNNTLVALSRFILDCANYRKAHSFPKISSFYNWLDSTIWDEDNRPTTKTTPINLTKETTQNIKDNERYMLGIPYSPINVPLQPGDNSVLPKMSLYESYIQNLVRQNSMTSHKPDVTLDQRNTPKVIYPKKYDRYAYS